MALTLADAHRLLRNPIFGSDLHIEAARLTALEAEIRETHKRLLDIYGYDFHIVPRLPSFDADLDALKSSLAQMKHVESEVC